MVLLNSFMTAYTQYWGFFLGAVLITIVLFFPKGIGGLLVDYCQSRKKRRET
jgi:branched-chain amino acid transport system permease protein